MRYWAGLIEIMAGYDAWCSNRLRDFLAWLVEWFSIDQYTFEKLLMVGYFTGMTLSGLPHGPWGWAAVGIRIACTILALGFTFALHKRPTRDRQIFELFIPDVYRAMRVTMQGFYLFMDAVMLCAVPRHWGDVSWVLGSACYVVLIYSFGIGAGGEKGKRRKKALAKLKGLLTPAPLPVPDLT